MIHLTIKNEKYNKEHNGQRGTLICRNIHDQYSKHSGNKERLYFFTFTNTALEH